METTVGPWMLLGCHSKRCACGTPAEGVGVLVRDATYCLDGIYGMDPRDNYTLQQQAPTGDFFQFFCNRDALKGAKFGLPWLSFWQLASANQQEQLLSLITVIETAGATIINGTELPSWQTIVSPDGWDWDYRTMRRYSLRSHARRGEYPMVKRMHID